MENNLQVNYWVGLEYQFYDQKNCDVFKDNLSKLNPSTREILCHAKVAGKQISKYRDFKSAAYDVFDKGAIKISPQACTLYTEAFLRMIKSFKEFQLFESNLNLDSDFTNRMNIVLGPLQGKQNIQQITKLQKSDNFPDTVKLMKFGLIILIPISILIASIMAYYNVPSEQTT